MRLSPVPSVGDYVGIDDKRTGQSGNFVYVAELVGADHRQTQWDILDQFGEARTIIRDKAEDTDQRNGWRDIRATY